MKRTLVIETERGIITREIRPASMLDEVLNHGTAAEESVLNASQMWGLPDFVYRAVEIDKGTARREVGDAFVIVEGIAAVVQVKGRPNPTESPEKECRWAKKQAATAMSQASGSLRTLRQNHVVLRNERGQAVEVKADSYRWLKVVVLEHEAPPAEFSQLDFETQGDAVVLLRTDWEFLFSEMRSTTAVLRYLLRSAPDAVHLGGHAEHYYSLAQIDEATSPTSPSFDSTGLKVDSRSMPQLPLAPAGVDGGEREVLFLSLIHI